MKKLMISVCFLLALGAASPASGQEAVKETGKDIKEAGKDAGKKVQKGARKVGRKSASLASKGKARITDAEHKDKVGPNGEKIYIDNHARFYWVDDRGRRHYVLEGELKDKTN